MDYLSRISIFVVVARLESFAGAARELGITSSAVSKQVQNLEAELKAKLLNRTTRSVSLTEEGALFFERASRALDDLEEAKDQLNELRATPRGALKISAPMSLGNSHLKTPIAQFARLYPEVSLDISFDDRLINLTEDGFDLVLRVGRLSDSSFIARKLADAPVAVCASPDYFERCGAPRTADDLARHNVLAYTRNKGAHEWRYQGPEGEGVVSLHSTLKADASDMMIAAACEGLGIIIIPEFFVQEHFATGCLVRVLEEYRHAPALGFYAIFPPNRFMSTRLRLFVDYMDAYCAKTFRNGR